MPADRPPHGPDQPGEGDDDPDKGDESGERADRPENLPERGKTGYSWRDFELADDEDTPPDGPDSQHDQDPGRTEHPEAEETGGGEAAERASGWHAPDVADHPDRPELEAIHLPADRRDHIRERHQHGASWSGKTEFPADWDEDRIHATVLDVARNPDETPVMQSHGRWRVEGTRDAVTIVAAVNPDGEIRTAYPKPGGPGVIENPRENQ